MLVFSKEKYLESEFKKLLARYNDGDDFINELNGKKVTVSEYDDYYCEGISIKKEYCEEREDETMEELLERWKKTKDADLLEACRIIEEQLDTADKYMDLLEEHESLQEEFEDYKKNVDENYEQKKIDPYYEYGVNESDFH